MIRVAEKKDLKGILSLYQQLFPNEDYSSASDFEIKWNEINDDPKCKYFIAVDSDSIVSTCTITIVPNLTRNQRSYAIIENVITHKDYRRKGIGRKILNEAIGYAREMNCYKIMLMSSSSRKEAHDFYHSIGFDGDSKKGFQLRIP